MTTEEMEDLVDELSNIHNTKLQVRCVPGFGYCLTDHHGRQLTDCMTKSEMHCYLQGAIDFNKIVHSN